MEDEEEAIIIDYIHDISLVLEEISLHLENISKSLECITEKRRW